MRKNVGIDLVHVVRFQRFARNKKHPFLVRAFSEGELAYCFSRANPAEHLAGMFAAKEAVAKALDAGSVAFIEIEIRHSKSGMPEAWRKKHKLPVSVSISHTNTLAAAIAMG